MFQNNRCVVKLQLVIFNFFKEYQYFIYAGACAVLLVLLFIVCVCCCRKKGRSTPKPTNKNPSHGITNYAMVNHFISNIGVQSFIILKKVVKSIKDINHLHLYNYFVTIKTQQFSLMYLNIEL